MAIALLDSYSESNFSTNYSMGADTVGGNKINIQSQSFTCPSSTSLYSAKFYLSKVGSPTGNATYKLYAVTGTSGTNAHPTGSALATSDNLDVSTLTGSYALIEQLFSGANAISLSASTVYALTFEYSGGDVSNYVQVGIDDTSPTHGGNNSFHYSTTWFDNSATDLLFYIYGGKASSAGLLLFE